MRRNVVFLVGTFVVVIGALVATVATGNSPVLGLDLQGGVSVRLVPVDNPSADKLDLAVDIIRNRVDSLGVAEAEVIREGGDVVVNLPGVKDRDKAQRIVGRTAELQFRPVVEELPAETTEPTTTAPSGSTMPTTAPPASTTTSAPPDGASGEGGEQQQPCPAIEPGPDGQVPTTQASDDRPDCEVVLPGRDVDGEPPVRYHLGPTELTGESVDGAKARFENQWVVEVDFTDEGSTQWDEVGERNFQRQVAIVLDRVVQSAPVIQPDNPTFQSFEGTAVISGDFSEGEAKDLATVLRFGALPVRFDEDQQTVEDVSPTLGRDQLRSGIAAGLVGIGLVAAYMLLYYRLLGLVVLVGLGVTAAATYSLVAYLGDAIGLALTLAGVTGLIVSVGVTVDSYVVYFERLKDEVRSGKTVRSSVDRGFARSFRTILAADLVSLIGATVLYLLAVGSVRGFAFFLGLSTVLDLLVAYFFMHPLVVLLARRPRLLRARYVGIASGLDAEGARA